MKKWLSFAVFASALSFANPARADFFYPAPMWPTGFPVQAQAWVTPYQISVSVQNPFNAPVVCEGRIAATTRLLGSGWLYFNTGVIYPWNFGGAYFVPPYGDFFVAGQAWVFCAYL